jgi:phage tail sheath protein FI
MAEYLSPGVYVEEIDAGPKPIEGVSTSTTGAVGVTVFGPTSGKPELVTSFGEFVRKFGGFLPDPPPSLYAQWALNREEGGRWWQFPLAVKGFFDNGGQRLFVKRVFSGTATAATATLGQGMISELDQDAAATANAVKVRHLIGIATGGTVGVFTGGDPPVKVDDFKVIGYDAGARTVKLDKPLGKALKAGRDFVSVFAIQPPSAGPPDTRTVTFRAKALGDWGKDLQVRMRPMVGATLNLLPDPVAGGIPFKTTVNKSRVTWVIEVDDMTGLAEGATISVKGKTYTISSLDTAFKTFEVTGVPPDDVVAPGEAVSIRTDSSFSTTVKTALNAAGSTIELNNVSDLAGGNLIRVDGREYFLDEDPALQGMGPTGTIEVSPPFPGPVAANTAVQKVLSPKIVSAGTRRIITLADGTGFNANSTFVFVPTNKEYLIKAKPADNVLQIVPAIPVGRDWESKQVRRFETRKVKTAVTTPGNALELKDITGLAQGDEVFIKGKKYTLTAAPAKGMTGTEGTITLAPPFAAPDLPIAADTDVKKLARDPVGVTATAANWTLDVNDASGLRANEHVLLGGDEYTISSITGNTLTILSHVDSDNPWPAGTAVRRLGPANNASAPNKIKVAGAAQLYVNALVELDNGQQKERNAVADVTGDTVALLNDLANTYQEGHKLRVVEAQVSVRYARTGQPLVEENFSNLRLTNDNSLSYFITNINTTSALVQVDDPPGDGFSKTDLTKFPIAANGAWAKLEGGNDKLEELRVEDFVGSDGGSGKRTGIQALEDIDEVSICLVPGMWSTTVQGALIQHCEILKDRFAILDPQDGLSIEGIRTYRETLDTKYAAVYYPWIEVRDPAAQRNVSVAPSGHMAGVYARVDVERGVHKAPANEVIRGITKISQDVSKREQDLLNPKGINALRFFPGRSNRVWGARTLSSDSSWKYINVRRLFIYVEESIDKGTQWVVFEPNDEPLWARVRQTITNFLTTTWRNGALQGLTPAEAFFVKCDRTTMSQDDIDNGRLICVIGIAPVKPAEFVIFRIQQKTLDSKPS